jgi:type II restriction/modification system DNA methylase subunit YeeA
MTPQDFIRKWKPVALTERATAQEHFLDLCRLFDHPTPAEDDPTGERFTFEKGVLKTGGGDGYADVWKKGFFAWEYKKKKRDLDKALEQLTRYAAALENPPLHVACDTHLFRVETRWTNEVPAKYEFELDDLADPKNLDILRAVFFDPEKLRSGRTRAKLTKEAADKFQTISDSLQHRNPDREAVAHFVNQLVFCFFADSVGLLPHGVWRKLLETASRKPEKSKQWLEQLFADMKDGGDFNLEDIAQFNGGLFDGRPPLRLEHTEIGLLFAAASLDWSLIDPTIFGTLFERFLDPDKRAQIGAHYTDPEKIMMIVEPVVARPLRGEWETVKREIEAIMAPALAASGGAGKAASAAIEKKFLAARAKAEAKRDAFIDRLCGLRILDPACGSGNFLYLALQAVKDIEYRAILECQTLGLGMVVPRVGPEILHGVEINPLAAELARTTIWIGDIQWRVKNAITHHPRPILRKLDSIECRDALLTSDGKGGFVEAEWPEADCIIGNPPFLGDKFMRDQLGAHYTETLRNTYVRQVPGSADLVCYWFHNATKHLTSGLAKRAGFVATNSIRVGSNRSVLDDIVRLGHIFCAWSNEEWNIEGAAIRVSLVCFDLGVSDHIAQLDGQSVAKLNADLSSGSVDLTIANQLVENADCAFNGITKKGSFDVSGEVARDWITLPINPNGRPNSDVLRPWLNGEDITARPAGKWIIDFGERTETQASLYELPFRHVVDKVRPRRKVSGSPGEPGLFNALY